MKDTLLLWLPRTAGAAVALFLGVFAFPALLNATWPRGLAEFLIHLVPALIVLLVVLVAWRRPLFGAVAFPLLAGAYAVTTRRMDWVLVIAGPMALAGVLYLASWIRLRAQ